LCLARRHAWWGALAGLFLFVALYNFARSLQGGAVRTNAPIFRLNFTITAATMTMALTNLFCKIGLQHGAVPETMVAAQAWMFCSLATLSSLLRERQLRVPPGALPYAALAALALFGAFVLLMHGLLRGPASVLVPVAQMSFVFTALFGASMFGERLDARKCAGLAVAAIALVLFAVS
jgi:uncharacterized membrane protein